MSAIATVLHDMGHEVSGSDLKDSPVAERLRSKGIIVALGHRPENVGRAEVVTYSPAVATDNVELVEAAARDVRIAPRSEMLAAICATRQCLAVAGTHGKTTTASMLSLILVEAGLRPSFVIGADVNEIGTNAVWDTGEWLVVEADESYGTFGAIRPDLAVLTNVEADHLDFYGTLESLRAAFAEFVASSSRGTVVCADDELAAAIGAEHGATSVGEAPGADYRILDLVAQRSSVSFTLRGPDAELGVLTIGVPGRHNARTQRWRRWRRCRPVPPLRTPQAALARFAGVSRRFEFRGEANGVTFVDDYAHLPTEVRAALATAAAGAGRGGRGLPAAPVLAHRGARGGVRHRLLGRGRPVITDVYSAGERPVPGRLGPVGGRRGTRRRSRSCR